MSGSTAAAIRAASAPRRSSWTRIITVADVFDAINATRPYRAAIPIDASLAMMRGQVGTAIDGDCFAALERMVASGAPEVEELELADR
jgi:HD-GYP domain-containing protein (c-di-GMP phosphodiesterase class II)